MCFKSIIFSLYILLFCVPFVALGEEESGNFIPEDTKYYPKAGIDDPKNLKFLLTLFQVANDQIKEADKKTDENIKAHYSDYLFVPANPWFFDKEKDTPNINHINRKAERWESRCFSLKTENLDSFKNVLEIAKQKNIDISKIIIVYGEPIPIDFGESVPPAEIDSSIDISNEEEIDLSGASILPLGNKNVNSSNLPSSQVYFTIPEFIAKNWINCSGNFGRNHNSVTFAMLLRSMFLYLNYGGNLSSQNVIDKASTLHRLGNQTSHTIAELFLIYSANPNIQDVEGNTALHYTFDYNVRGRTNKTKKSSHF